MNHNKSWPKFIEGYIIGKSGQNTYWVQVEDRRRMYHEHQIRFPKYEIKGEVQSKKYDWVQDEVNGEVPTEKEPRVEIEENGSNDVDTGVRPEIEANNGYGMDTGVRPGTSKSQWLYIRERRRSRRSLGKNSEMYRSQRFNEGVNVELHRFQRIRHSPVRLKDYARSQK